MHLLKLFETEFYPLKLCQRAPGTVAHYRRALRFFERHLGHHATLDDLTDLNVAKFLAGELARGRDPQSVNTHRKYLLAYWRWLARKGHVAVWPDVEKLKESPPTPDAWTKEQLAALFAACEKTGPPIGRVPSKIFWPALHFWIWDTGERTGATLRVNRNSVNLTSGVALVPADIRKGNKNAVYQLKDRTICFLGLVQKFTPSDDRLLPWPYDMGTFYNRYTKLLKDAGLPSGRRNKPQKIRRSCASFIEAAGGSAQEFLMHESRATTVASYIDPLVCRTESQNVKLFDPTKRAD